MGKRTNRIPSALKHGIYSGIGLLPTEDPTEFQEFKKQIFAELGLTGRLEEEIGEEIVCLEWRRKNLSTYAVAERARTRYESIFSVFGPQRELNIPPASEARIEELKALLNRVDKEIQTDLGAAIELVEIGDAAKIEYLEKELAIRERLDGMITRAYKKLLYVRGIKSMSSSSEAVSPQLLLGRAA
jgi:hypothetical protein